VRLEFDDGCIANLTASRVSTEKVRKLRLFQPKQYVSVDYAKQAAVLFTVGGPIGISFQQLPVTQAEPLKLQFEAFLDSVETRRTPKLDGHTARQTLELALAVLGKIEEHAGVVEKTLASGWKP
jgi:predicted dehydrogenase